MVFRGGGPKISDVMDCTIYEDGTARILLLKGFSGNMCKRLQNKGSDKRFAAMQVDGFISRLPFFALKDSVRNSKTADTLDRTSLN